MERWSNPLHFNPSLFYTACAQIVDVSGATEILKETFRDTDGTSVMTAATTPPLCFLVR